MSRQVCRDFQRGSCRFGTRCKFLHQLPQQQQTQRNAFDSGPRQTQQQQGFNSNRFGALSNTAPASNSQRQQLQQPPAKDHKCNNPKVCQDQIKEDARTEQPTFWRLTSYGHWKFLPNDICGDVSPEELRGLAYESAKQGMSIQQVVQKEQSLVAAKNAEFEALLRNPYRGPVATQASTGFTQGTIQPSSFLSTPQPSTNTIFGVPQNSTTPTMGFGQPQTIFGVPTVTSQQAAGGFGNTFNQTGPTALAPGPSPFQATGFGQAGQTVFGTRAAPAIQTIFGTKNSTAFGNGNTAFGNGNTVFGGGSGTFASGFGTQAPFTTPSANTMSTGFGNFTQSPFNTSGAAGSSATPTGFGSFAQSPFITPAAIQPTSTHATMPATPFAPQISPAGSLSDNVQRPAGADDIWQKEHWKLGEIPEEEPPEHVRY